MPIGIIYLKRSDRRSLYFWRNDPCCVADVYLDEVLNTILKKLRVPFLRLRRRKTGSTTPESRSPDRPTVSRADVERLVGTPVGNMELYRQALLHRSVLRGKPETHLLSYERLEFLGDAVLGFVVAEHLYVEFPDRNEGFLTRVRAKIVNGQALAGFAQQLELGPLVLMSENMDQSGGRRTPTILADALEAVIGALYLDLGEQAARVFIKEKILNAVDLEDLALQRNNYKSILLEHAQAMGWTQPQYRIIDEHGPSHDKVFTVEVLLNEAPFGTGEARNKKKAEQKAAREALDRLHDSTPDGLNGVEWP